MFESIVLHVHVQSITYTCVVHFIQWKAGWEGQLKSAEMVSVEMLTCFLLWCVTVCGVTCVWCTIGV